MILSKLLKKMFLFEPHVFTLRLEKRAAKKVWWIPLIPVIFKRGNGQQNE